MKVLIVGLGSIAKKHIQALLSIDPDTEIYALRSSAGSPVYDGVKNIYVQDDLWQHTFDFAILSTPTALHKEGIELLSGLGCPLFIEKPLYHDLSIKNLVKEVKEKGIPTYIGCNLRFLDCLSYSKNYISSPGKRINEVNAYCGSYLPEWRKGKDYRQIYSAIPGLGGGVHLDLIHELDYVYWLFGAPVVSTGNFSNHSSLGIHSYDYANYLFKYDMFNISIILNYYRRDPKRTLEIVFSDETIMVDLLHNTVTNSDGKVIFKSNQEISDTYREQMKNFIFHVKGGKLMSNDITQGYEILKLCLKSSDNAV